MPPFCRRGSREVDTTTYACVERLAAIMRRYEGYETIYERRWIRGIATQDVHTLCIEISHLRLTKSEATRVLRAHRAPNGRDLSLSCIPAFVTYLAFTNYCSSSLPRNRQKYRDFVLSSLPPADEAWDRATYKKFADMFYISFAAEHMFYYNLREHLPYHLLFTNTFMRSEYARETVFLTLQDIAVKRHASDARGGVTDSPLVEELMTAFGPLTGCLIRNLSARAHTRALASHLLHSSLRYIKDVLSKMNKHGVMPGNRGLQHGILYGCQSEEREIVLFIHLLLNSPVKDIFYHAKAPTDDDWTSHGFYPVLMLKYFFLYSEIAFQQGTWDPAYQEQECAICLENTPGERRVLHCRGNAVPHVFHTKCVEPWLFTSGRCPMCREESPARVVMGGASLFDVEGDDVKDCGTIIALMNYRCSKLREEKDKNLIHFERPVRN